MQTSQPQPLVNIGPLACGEGQPLLLIAGPCVIQSRDLTLSIAQRLTELSRTLSMPLVFKASFDKANRTSRSGYRGLGMETGLRILEEVGATFGVPTVTDVHLPDQAASVAQVCDLLQIPAFLARQTDLLEAAAATGKPLHVKKGQFMSPGDMQYVLEKVQAAGSGGCMLCERGTFFGYGRLVNDMQALPLMRRLGCTGCIRCDAFGAAARWIGWSHGRQSGDGGTVGPGSRGRRYRWLVFRNSSRSRFFAQRWA